MLFISISKIPGGLIEIFIRRLGFIIAVIVIMIILYNLGLPVYAAAVITFFLSIGIYLGVNILTGKKRLSLLDDHCDPEAFLDVMDRIRKKIPEKNQKAIAYANLNISAALILMGNLEEAKEVLLSIDRNLLSHSNGTMFTYAINLISCLYELGETDQAEKLFEILMPVVAPAGRKRVLTAKIFVAERFFFLKRYNESREHFTQLPREKMCLRNRLEILYRLAQMDEISGDLDAALKKYRIVAEKGNKLWIAARAKEKLKEANVPD